MLALRDLSSQGLNLRTNLSAGQASAPFDGFIPFNALRKNLGEMTSELVTNTVSLQDVYPINFAAFSLRTDLRNGGSSDVSTDPNWSNVVFYSTGNQPNGTTTILNYCNEAAPYTNNTTTAISNAVSLFGKNVIATGTSYADGLTTNLTSSLNVSGKSFTIEGWFYCTSLNSQASHVFMFSNGVSPPSPDYELWLSITTSGLLYFAYYADSGGHQINYTSSVTPSLNAWHYFAVSYDYSANKYYLFYDGTLVNSWTVTGNLWLSANMSLHLGSPWANGTFANYTLKGYMANVRMTLVCRYDNSITATVPTARFPVGY